MTELVKFFRLTPNQFIDNFADKLVPIYKFRDEEYHEFRSYVLRARHLNVYDLLTNNSIPNYTDEYKTLMYEYAELKAESKMDDDDLKHVSRYYYPLLPEEYIAEHMTNDDLTKYELVEHWRSYNANHDKERKIHGSCCVDYISVLTLKDVIELYKRMYSNSEITLKELKEFIIEHQSDESMEFLSYAQSYLPRRGPGRFIITICFNEEEHAFKYA